MTSRFRTGIRTFLGTLLLMAGLNSVSQAAISPSQFDITGFLEEATVSTPGNPLSGGSLKVNGHVVTVPANTIVILPANALTWEELFAQAPAPYTNISTGMAMADLPTPITTYEVHVIGNRIGDTYIAGLVNISQQDLNTGAGYVNFIDYATGEMRVGGVMGDATTGARVRINDPTGKFGPISTPDKRFTLDADNPTVRTETGFPMCLPRVAPAAATATTAAADDPLCPQGNRPKDTTGAFVGAFTMPDPATLVAGQLPDPRVQAPIEVGDYITFAGTLVTDTAASPTTGPFPGTALTYISAHTVIDNTAIYTAPGTNPAYVAVDVTIIGTGGLTVLGAGEAAIRTRFEGFTTDPSRNIHLYGIDVNPDGTTSDRDWGTIGVDQGPPKGAVKGRWRFRPPCLATVATDKACTPPPAGVFIPPTREVRAVIEGQQTQGNPATAKTAANGLFYGQYHAPILEYIFPENVPGTPPPPNNFEAIPFLACGGYIASSGTLAGQLNPWPGAAVPSCVGATVAPVASAGASQTVASGAPVTLTASATGNPAPTFTWVQTGGPAVVLSGTNPATFTAPSVAPTTTLSFQVTATNSAGSSTATTSVTVNAAAAPTVNPVTATTVASGTPVTLAATGSDPAGLALTYTWTQTGGTPVVINPNPTTGPSISFTLTLPVGTTTSTTLSFSVTATNSAGVSSAPTTTTVTVTPPADTVAIATSEYRIGKQRLVLTASSSIVSPNVVLTLQPYVTALGTVFDPAVLGNVFTNTGAGTYTLTLVGAPEPAIPPAAPLQIKSNIGGVSPFTALQKIRN